MSSISSGWHRNRRVNRGLCPSRTRSRSAVTGHRLKRRFMLSTTLLAIALAGAGGGVASAASPTFVPVAWDFVDTGLCGLPIHSVGTGQVAIHINSTEDRYFFTGPVTVTTTNVLTGRSLSFRVNWPAQYDFGAGTGSAYGQVLGIGAGLPYGELNGSTTFNLSTGQTISLSGTMSGVDLCSALSPGTVFFAPSSTAPPWGLPAAPLAGVHADGLVPPIFGLGEHRHVHLDIYVDGAHVTVPLGIGIVDPTSGGPESLYSAVGIYSPIHTHDDSGILHVEAGFPPYELTLGQFFDVWQVRLGDGCLGSSCTGLRAWVNGVEWTGDPRSIPIARGRDEIVLATGPSYPDPVPSTYTFPFDSGADFGPPVN